MFIDLFRQFLFSAIKNITKSKRAKKYANNCKVSFNRDRIRLRTRNQLDILKSNFRYLR